MRLMPLANAIKNQGVPSGATGTCLVFLERLNQMTELAKQWRLLAGPLPQRYLRAPIVRGQSLLAMLSTDPLDDSAIRRAMLALRDRIAQDQRRQPAIADILRKHGFSESSKEVRAERVRRASRVASRETDSWCDGGTQRQLSGE